MSRGPPQSRAKAGGLNRKLSTVPLNGDTTCPESQQMCRVNIWFLSTHPFPPRSRLVPKTAHATFLSIDWRSYIFVRFRFDNDLKELKQLFLFFEGSHILYDDGYCGGSINLLHLLSFWLRGGGHHIQFAFCKSYSDLYSDSRP